MGLIDQDCMRCLRIRIRNTCKSFRRSKQRLNSLKGTGLSTTQSKRSSSCTPSSWRDLVMSKSPNELTTETRRTLNASCALFNTSSMISSGSACTWDLKHIKVESSKKSNCVPWRKLGLLQLLPDHSAKQIESSTLQSGSQHLLNSALNLCLSLGCNYV